MNAYTSGKQSDIFFVDKSTGQRIPIYKKTHTIGRSVEDIAFPADRSVSRQHFRTHLEGHLIFIEDLNSSNRTFVNSRPLTPHLKHPLRHGDVVTMGRQTLVFSYTADGRRLNNFETASKSNPPIRSLTATAQLKNYTPRKARALVEKLKNRQMIFAFIFVAGTAALSMFGQKLYIEHQARNPAAAEQQIETELALEEAPFESADGEYFEDYPLPEEDSSAAAAVVEEEFSPDWSASESEDSFNKREPAASENNFEDTVDELSAFPEIEEFEDTNRQVF